MKLAPRNFYQTKAWAQLRAKALLTYGSRCRMCFRGPKNGVRIEVHHVKPRALHPELELEFDNLDVLCEVCHAGVHWLAWGIKQGAMNDPYFDLHPTPRREDFVQLELLDEDADS